MFVLFFFCFVLFSLREKSMPRSIKKKVDAQICLPAREDKQYPSRENPGEVAGQRNELQEMAP